MTAKTALLKKKKSNDIKEELGWYLFILPLILGLLIFSLYPMIMSLWYSFFTNYNGEQMLPTFSGINQFGRPVNYFGWANYQRLFDFSRPDSSRYLGDDAFKSLGITFLYAIIAVPGCLVLSFGVALMVNSKIKGVGIFRTLYYLPVIIPSVIWGALWSNILRPFETGGLFNGILTQMGLPVNKFLLGKDTAFPTFLSLNLWTLGASMILWLSALKNVPESLLEAAKLDGAGYFRRVITVIIPMCSSILFYNMVTGMIGALQMMGNVKALTGGGGEDNLPFYALWIYNFGFSGMERGFACAMAWVLFVIIGLLTALIFKSSGWVYYGDGGDK